MGNFLTWHDGDEVGGEVRSVKRKREDSEAQEEASVKRQIVRSSSRTPSDVSGVRDVKKGNVKLNDYLEWVDGIIPYVLDCSLSDEVWMVVELAMDTIEKHSRIRFVERSNNEDTYVEIYKGDGCFFRRGDGFQQPHRVSLGIGCEDFGIVLHELMHAIGFPHEQRRPDRDDYITIHCENIKPGKEKQFKKLESSEYKWSDFKFDFDSIMMYEETAFSKNGLKTIEAKNGETIPRNENLSAMDIEKLMSL